MIVNKDLPITVHFWYVNTPFTFWAKTPLQFFCVPTIIYNEFRGKGMPNHWKYLIK